jgi:hypothetical protein
LFSKKKVLVNFESFQQLPLKLALILLEANRRLTILLSESVSVCASVKGSWRDAEMGM